MAEGRIGAGPDTAMEFGIDPPSDKFTTVHSDMIRYLLI